MNQIYVLGYKLRCYISAGESGDNLTVGTKVPCQFKVGDKVRVDLEPEILKAMQEGHGGWNPRMAEVCFYLCFY